MEKEEAVESAGQLAFTRLQTAIQAGMLTPNQRLVERDLEKLLGLSRTPIREALRELEKIGLIEHHAKRGAVVRDAGPKEIIEVFEVRLSLERLAFDLMRPFSVGEMRALKGTHRRLATAVRERNAGLMVRLNDEFHDLIIAVADSAFLSAQLSQLRQRTYLIRHRSWENQVRVEKFVSEHAEIVKLLEDEDWDAYIREIIDHIMIPVRLYFAHSMRVSDQDRQEFLRLENLASALASRPRLASMRLRASRSMTRSTGTGA
ncbi:MAG: GntR family transcriptional regulator [Lautropia sp.]